jgi:hypothetical protein
MMLSAATNDAVIKIVVYRIGPALLFERLWRRPVAARFGLRCLTTNQRPAFLGLLKRTVLEAKFDQFA